MGVLDCVSGVYVNCFALGTAVTRTAPLYAATPAPLMTTRLPTERPFAAVVRTVAVVPLEVRPGATSRNEPPPEFASPLLGLVNVKPRDDGVEVTVNGPPL